MSDDYGPSELSQLLNVSYDTIARRGDDGLLPCYQVDGKRRYPKHLLDPIIAEHRDTTAPADGGDLPDITLPDGRTVPALYTTGDVAALFNVDRKTVMRWAATRRLAGIRTRDGRRRFHADEVHAVLEATRQERGETDA